LAPSLLYVPQMPNMVVVCGRCAGTVSGRSETSMGLLSLARISTSTDPIFRLSSQGMNEGIKNKLYENKTFMRRTLLPDILQNFGASTKQGLGTNAKIRAPLPGSWQAAAGCWHRNSRHLLSCHLLVSHLAKRKGERSLIANNDGFLYFFSSPRAPPDAKSGMTPCTRDCCTHSMPIIYHSIAKYHSQGQSIDRTPRSLNSTPLGRCP